MSLAEEYRRQFQWRDWPTVFAALPPLEGATVLDLGCGVGDLAAELAARGARVTGFDASEELIGAARARGLREADFRVANLGDDLEFRGRADGIWCSFAAAFFPDLPTALRRWARHLKAGGWIAVTEIDDLFGHEPLPAGTRILLGAYAEQTLAEGRYDFRMGRKLEGYLQQAGFEVTNVLTLADQELACDGPVSPGVREAWRDRFRRMTLLRSFCGARMQEVEDEFIGCLGSDDHRSIAKVYCCIARATASCG